MEEFAKFIKSSITLTQMSKQVAKQFWKQALWNDIQLHEPSNERDFSKVVVLQRLTSRYGVISQTPS